MQEKKKQNQTELQKLAVLTQSCPMISNPKGNDSVAYLTNDISSVKYSAEVETQDLDHAVKQYENKGLKKPSGIIFDQLHTNRKIKSDQPETSHPYNEQINSASKFLRNHTFGEEKENLTKEQSNPSPGGEKEVHKIDFDLNLNDPRLPKKHWIWLFCATLFIYFATILALMIKLIVFQLVENPFPLGTTSGALEYIAENLGSDPIINITLSKGLCPEGYELLKLYTWPGTRDGCYYPEKDYLQPDLCDDINDYDEATSSGKNVYSLYQEDLFYWQDFHWCVKRANKGIDYLVTGECPTDYRRCASGYCFQQALECPVTGVELNKDMSGQLILSREVNQLPIVSISVSINGLPCFSLEEKPAKTSEYILLASKENGCNNYGPDSASFQIDTDTQENLLLKNNASSTIFTLPGYQSVLKNTLAILTARKRLELTINDFCLSVNRNILIETSDSIKKLYLAVSRTTTSVLIFHSIIGLLLVNFFCGRICSKKPLGYFLWKERLCYKSFFLVLYCFEAITLITLGTLVIIRRVELSSSHDYFSQLVANNCFGQSQAGTIVSSFDAFIHDTISTILIYSVISFGISILFLVILIKVVRIIVKKRVE